jgi:hypothetical protein
MNFSLNDRLLKYFNEDCILIYCNIGVYTKNPKWKEIVISNDAYGYQYINIGNKIYKLHRLLGYLFLGLDIENSKHCVEHMNRCRYDNRLENLKIVYYL